MVKIKCITDEALVPYRNSEKSLKLWISSLYLDICEDKRVTK